METIKFSVIIPVYNTKFIDLDRCLSSIYSQVYKNFEVIVVDDGSNKECVKNLESLKEKYNFILVHQINKGLPGARNSGIRNASGDYYIFVDSDDVISGDYLYSANEYLKSKKVDLIISRIQYDSFLNGKLKKLELDECMPEDIVAIKDSFLQNSDKPLFYTCDSFNDLKKSLLDIKPREITYRILGSACSLICNRNIFNKVMFNESVKICEDQIFIRELLQNIDNVLVVPDIWYHYIQNLGSMLHNHKNIYTFEKTRTYWDALYLVYSNEDDAFLKEINYRNINYCWYEIRKILNSDMKTEDKKYQINVVCSHQLVQMSLKNYKYNNMLTLCESFLIRKKFYNGMYGLNIIINKLKKYR